MEIVREHVRIFGDHEPLSGELAYPAIADPLFAALIVGPHPYMGGTMQNALVAAIAGQIAIAGGLSLRFDYGGAGEGGGGPIDVAESMAAFWAAGHAPEDPERLEDASRAFEYLEELQVAPRIVIGYSFGAAAAFRLTDLDSRVEATVLISPTLTRHESLFSWSAATGGKSEILVDDASPKRKRVGVTRETHTIAQTPARLRLGLGLLVIHSDDDFCTPLAIVEDWVQRVVPHAERVWVAGGNHFFRGNETAIAARVSEFCVASSESVLDPSPTRKRGTSESPSPTRKLAPHHVSNLRVGGAGILPAGGQNARPTRENAGGQNARPTTERPNASDAGIAAVERRLRDVLALHLDPRDGSRYWLERQQSLEFDIRREIRTISDLPRLGTMSPRDLASRPLADFVPRSLHPRRNDWIVAQTGGTSGQPVWAAYLPEEFEAAFVTPFAVAANHVGFPRGGNWLFVGPSGPHIIGRAALRLARVMGSPEPFLVDFDPRWARKLPDGSFVQRRYVQHVVDQALAVLETQSIEILFTTPSLLAALAQQLPTEERERIRGVHYGGTHLGHELLLEFQTRWFPGAVHLSGYGNTLFGCCLELETRIGRVPSYFPFGDRLMFSAAPATRTLSDESNKRQRICFSRLDRTMLLINVVERDAAELVPAPAGAPVGFEGWGVRDVGPAECENAPPTGLY